MSQQINLLRPASRKAQFSFTSPRVMAYGLGIAVAASVMVAVYESRQLRAVELDAARVGAAVKKATLAHDKAIAGNVPRKPNAELAASVADLEAQLKARQDIVDALRRGSVGSSAGFSEYMRVFSRQSLPGVWLTGFDIGAGGDELTISGRALNPDLVPAYLQRLNREAAIQGRPFGSMVINQPPQPAKTEQQGPESKGHGPTTSYLEFTLASTHPGLDRGRDGARVQHGESSSLMLQAPVDEPVGRVPNIK